MRCPGMPFRKACVVPELSTDETENNLSDFCLDGFKFVFLRLESISWRDPGTRFNFFLLSIQQAHYSMFGTENTVLNTLLNQNLMWCASYLAPSSLCFCSAVFTGLNWLVMCHLYILRFSIKKMKCTSCKCCVDIQLLHFKMENRNQVQYFAAFSPHGMNNVQNSSM